MIFILDTFGGESGPADFDSLIAIASDAGANTIFDFGGGNTLTLVGVNIADLSASNFNSDGITPAASSLTHSDLSAAEMVDVFDMDALI